MEVVLASPGRLYLIPTTLGNIDPQATIPHQAADAIATIDLFVVERVSSAARFLGRMGIGERLETCIFIPIDRLQEPETLSHLLGELERGRNVGVLSEAGCPGVADPGSVVVRAAHDRELPIVPVVGPSSIILALMASGLNGQEFAFRGYLPVDKTKRRGALRDLEATARGTNQTQIFIEAPHRNDQLLSDLLETCRPDTSLCVALDITLPSEYIRTRRIADWRRAPITIGKRPAIFLVGRTA